MVTVTSDKGYKFIKEMEGLRLNKYVDAGGIETIGYGHTGKNLPSSIGVADALEFLRDDIHKCEGVLNAQHLALKQYEFDALISFIFNVGAGKFLKSSLLKSIVQHKRPLEVRKCFLKYVYCNKKEVPGLKRRRNAEANLFFAGDYSTE